MAAEQNFQQSIQEDCNYTTQGVAWRNYLRQKLHTDPDNLEFEEFGWSDLLDAFNAGYEAALKQ